MAFVAYFITIRTYMYFAKCAFAYFLSAAIVVEAEATVVAASVAETVVYIYSAVQKYGTLT